MTATLTKPMKTTAMAQLPPPGYPPRAAAHSWWQTTASYADTFDRLCQKPFRPDNPNTAYGRGKGLARVLDWLSAQPGGSWQERWIASGADDKRSDWPDLAVAWLAAQGRTTSNDRNHLTTGMMLLLAGQVIRPSYRWMCAQRPSQAWIAAQHHIDADGFAMLTRTFEARRLGHVRFRREALIRIVWILLRKGGMVKDITVGDCVELDYELKARGRHTGHGRRLFYLLLSEAGVLPDQAPPTLRAAAEPGQQSTAVLISRYGIQSHPVRDLLIEYIDERRPSLDYISVGSLVYVLGKLFWRDLERHEPGLDTLRLSPKAAEDWKQRLAYIRDRDGRPLRPRKRAEGYLLTVRSFYRDLAGWAAEDPARWGPWVAPCPIRANECEDRKSRARSKAALDQRTRVLLPALPALVDAIGRSRQFHAELLQAARQQEPHQQFTYGGLELTRTPSNKSSRVYVTDHCTGKRWDVTAAEERSFWAWAMVEVLRHTGMRIEELMELTHYSFIAYTLPSTGEVVPMLQIAPSKTDSERLLLVSPELGEVLATVISRVRASMASIPLVSAYDMYERVWSAPMPFLMQRQHGAEHRAITAAYLRNCLTQAAAHSGLAGPSGAALHFSPHDFRRIFTTDAIRNGLPPHIAAKILGHVDLNTTLGYAAIYPDDVIAHHRAFIAQRRTFRPASEYRDLTAAEWDEFLGHFELRKVSLGVCTRDYGTPCAHEHACVRCPMLRPDPAQMPRLIELRDNLQDRLTEAGDMGWLGEVAGLKASLDAAERKLAAMRNLATEHQTVHLGMPDFRHSTGRT